ncbi:hypothetical protein HID58_042185 [Brassica napus]|uniref:Uncharacterized protein n=1 Tax=Brassica napus TaxID=3708 RepID=A0ABQ8BD03_BRANA|nr:hypothetical protein HID58_042185 [Brassica napus]
MEQRQRQQLRSSMMAEKDEKLSFFLEMRGVRKSMIIFFSTIIMSSDLGMFKTSPVFNISSDGPAGKKGPQFCRLQK